MTANTHATDEVQGRQVLIRVAIPHYFRPGDDALGYASTRLTSSRAARAVALGRCLGSVMALARGPEEQILSIIDQRLVVAPKRSLPSGAISNVFIDCHVFVRRDDCLNEVLELFQDQIHVHELELDDPRRLPHAARDFLLNDDGNGSAHLSLYLEDDLVIDDRLFIEKQLWFLERSRYKAVLMPHRFERAPSHGQPRLFVDGPIDPSAFPDHHRPLEGAARGCFQGGPEILFDLASNPHSGCFAVSQSQRRWIQQRGVVDDGFVGPLETVATFTVLKHFPVLKPSWHQRDFLCVEHAHPSYLPYRDVL